MHQDHYNLAKLAVEEIIKTIESVWDGAELDGPVNSIILPPTLVVRQSSLHLKED
jgi:DNA-binding LacI/PurR family transcriptional regulator